MSTVSELAFRYSAKGAKAVQRADRNVRDSISQTAKTAQKEQGTINRWMEANASALRTIGAVAAGAMAGILAQSPTLRAELSSVRIAMSLLADDMINTLFPGGLMLADMAFGLVDAFGALPDPIQRVISALTIVGTVVTGALAGLSGLVQLLGGGGLIPILQGSAGAILGFAGALGAVLGVVGVAILQVTGVLDVIRSLGQTVGSVGTPALTDFQLAFLSVVTAGVLPAIAALGGFITGFLEGGIPEGVARASRALGIFRDAFVDTGARVRDTFIDLINRAKAWGSAVIDRFISGLLSARDRLIGWLNELKSQVESRLSLSTNTGVQQNVTNVVNQNPAPAGGGNRVDMGDINVELRGSGSSRRDGQNIAQEVSDEIRNQFESRR